MELVNITLHFFSCNYLYISATFFVPHRKNPLVVYFVKHAVELIPFVQVKQQKIWCDCVKLCHSSFRELAEANAVFRNIFGVKSCGFFATCICIFTSSKDWIHERFMSRLGKTTETEDSSNRLSDLHTQHEWLCNMD